MVENLKTNNLYGEKVELVRYNIYDIEEFRIYELYIKSESSDQEKYITLKETYPDNYTIILNF